MRIQVSCFVKSLKINAELPKDEAPMGAPDMGAPDMGAPDMGAPDMGGMGGMM